MVSWVPNHCDIEKNQKADTTAKKADKEKKNWTAKWTSLFYRHKQIIKEKKIQLLSWQD